MNPAEIARRVSRESGLDSALMELDVLEVLAGTRRRLVRYPDDLRASLESRILQEAEREG